MPAIAYTSDGARCSAKTLETLIMPQDAAAHARAADAFTRIIERRLPQRAVLRWRMSPARCLREYAAHVLCRAGGDIRHDAGAPVVRTMARYARQHGAAMVFFLICAPRACSAADDAVAARYAVAQRALIPAVTLALQDDGRFR